MNADAEGKGSAAQLRGPQCRVGLTHGSALRASPARQAFLELRRVVELLGSAGEVEGAARRWRERRG